MQTAQRAFVALLALALTVGAAQVLASQQESAAGTGKSITGELTNVDTSTQTFSVKTSDGAEMQFSYNDLTEVTGAQKEVAGLATRSGSQVTVHYTENEGVKTATKIEVSSAK
jgi:methionine-rich copper-binding protein CopC